MTTEEIITSPLLYSVVLMCIIIIGVLIARIHPPILAKRRKAYDLAKHAGLLDSKGKPTDEYESLIVKVTSKDKMADMTLEEADSFLEALEKLAKARQIQRASWLEDPWSRRWTWIIVFLVISGSLLLVDYFVGSETLGSISPGGRRLFPRGLSGGERAFGAAPEVSDGITWAPVVIAVLMFNMASAAILRLFLKRHGRNPTAWTTAIVVFTPILAGIAYLLTWPKDKPQNG